MRGGIFPPARPAVLSEAKVLQEGEGNAGHQRMSVQFRPRAPLEVTQPQGRTGSRTRKGRAIMSSDNIRDGDRYGRFVVLQDADGALHAVTATAVSALCSWSGSARPDGCSRASCTSRAEPSARHRSHLTTRLTSRTGRSSAASCTCSTASWDCRRFHGSARRAQRCGSAPIPRACSSRGDTDRAGRGDRGSRGTSPPDTRHPGPSGVRTRYRGGPAPGEPLSREGRASTVGGGQDRGTCPPPRTR